MKSGAKTLNCLYTYYTQVEPKPKVLELCGIHSKDAPYTTKVDPTLTVIINGYGRPAFLPLVWEAIQYQTRRPCETWIIQNGSQDKFPAPRAFFTAARNFNTRIIDSDINHGCWFRFILAALYCRTRYVAIYDDDTLSGRMALGAALADLEKQSGIYGCWGVTFKEHADGPKYLWREAAGWANPQDKPVQVDFLGQMWVLETAWLREILKYLPERLLTVGAPGRECGEELMIAYVGQKMGKPCYIYSLGMEYGPRWASIQGIEMGDHPAALHRSGGLAQADFYLQHYRAQGWRLLRF